MAQQEMWNEDLCKIKPYLRLFISPDCRLYTTYGTSCRNYSSFHSHLSSTKDKTHSCGLENCRCTYCKLHEDVATGLSVQEPVGATYNTVPSAWMQRKTSLRLTEKDSLHWQRLTGTTQAPFITVIINDPQCCRSEKKNLSFKGIKKSKMTAKKSSINNKVGTALG